MQRLLDGHGLATLDWSSHPNFAHVLWGALFCLPSGFSFAALRVSTWVAALLGLCGFLLLLRALGHDRPRAALGTALLGLNPVFFVLATTYISKRFTHDQATRAIVTSYYWHFVDVVWIALFFMIYVLR